MMDPQKLTLPYFRLVTIQNLLILFHYMWAHIGIPQNLGHLGHPTLWQGARVPLGNLYKCITKPKLVTLG